MGNRAFPHLPPEAVGRVRIGKPTHRDTSQGAPPTLTPADGSVGDIPLGAEVLPGVIVLTDKLTTELENDMDPVLEGEQHTTRESEVAQTQL